MKRNFCFLYLLCILFLTTSYCQALDSNQIESINSVEKTYVNSDDLVIIDQKLFLIDEDELIALKSISVDEFGIYVEKLPRNEQIGPCKEPVCAWCQHPIYCKLPQGCGGCSNWFCGLRCKCNSPW